jgi:leucyl aminopeptidase (aminopeptidase T)
MKIYFRNGLITEISKEIGEKIMATIADENNGYVKLSKLQAVYDLNDKPFLVLNLDEVVYIQ